ncbi:hypothetical protein [Gloeobacter violaceus]|uniref:Gsr1623 protein n=1 Tax=Gloeobacter violaceus (strain ATCC 29082 / PCC 7421) TaxID=251221 RepID=Q7NK57_GLOVI|nr:hypothetical protein [Gloeobacter violaceus]BAC89564.1 gsr1623 [Gloeobacter violaceus PCC 7421]
MPEPQLDIPQELPLLKALCWQTGSTSGLSPREMLQIYERGWRFRGVLADLGEQEREFLQKLIHRFGSDLDVSC